MDNHDEASGWWLSLLCFKIKATYLWIRPFMFPLDGAHWLHYGDRDVSLRLQVIKDGRGLGWCQSVRICANLVLLARPGLRPSTEALRIPPA